jgi:hypothetical protein
MLQLGFEQIVITIPRRFIDSCRNVDLSVESCALHPESGGDTRKKQEYVSRLGVVKGRSQGCKI